MMGELHLNWMHQTDASEWDACFAEYARLAELARLAYSADWADATLRADDFFAAADVSPVHAALLLCQFNPDDTSFEVAKKCSSDKLSPEQLIRLEHRFTDISKADPKARTLKDWFDLATSLNLRCHSWVGEYIEARGIQNPIADAPAPAETTTPETQASQKPTNETTSTYVSVTPTKNKRRDLLTPLIEAAQIKAGDPYDVPKIWAELRKMACDKEGPMTGVAPDGIQWTDSNDDAQFFGLSALRERIARQKRRATSV